MMLTRNRYEMAVTSYKEHGSEITFRRNLGAGRLSSFIVMIMSNILLFPVSFWKQSSLQLNVFLVSLVLTVAFITHAVNRIHTESLLILSSVGVMFKQMSMISTKSIFYDISSIRDIVILEAISKQSVIFQLVLLPNTKPTNDETSKIYPLFKTFQPKLDDLKTIYRHVQEKLIIPGRTSKESSETSAVN